VIGNPEDQLRSLARYRETGVEEEVDDGEVTTDGTGFGSM
jgi:hypothetical protein